VSQEEVDVAGCLSTKVMKAGCPSMRVDEAVCLSTRVIQAGCPSMREEAAGCPNTRMSRPNKNKMLACYTHGESF
jgi:hypothetical protein